MWYQVTSILVEDANGFCIITSALTPEYLTVVMGQCGLRSDKNSRAEKKYHRSTQLQLTPSPVPQTSIAQKAAVFVLDQGLLWRSSLSEMKFTQKLCCFSRQTPGLPLEPKETS